MFEEQTLLIFRTGCSILLCGTSPLSPPLFSNRVLHISMEFCGEQGEKCEVCMVNFHQACDSTLSVQRGAAVAKLYLKDACPLHVNQTLMSIGEAVTEKCSLVFTDRRVDLSFFEHIRSNQTVNRIPNLDTLTMKAPLAAALERFDKDHNSSNKEVYDWGHFATSIAPRTFILPQHEDFLKRILLSKSSDQDVFPTYTPSEFYICKPNNGSQGNGIHIAKGLSGVLSFFHDARNNSEFDGSYVIQPYINNPALYGNVKFDLRVYVVMVGDGCCKDASGCYEPCKAYLLRSGFARLCSTPYESVSSENQHIATMHIANDGVNFKNNVKMSDILRTTEHVLDKLVYQSNNNITHEKLWNQLSDLVSKVVIALQYSLRQLNEVSNIPFATDAQHTQCYQLLGLDVMIDNDYKMWLLECNAKPCMDWEKEEIDQTVGPAINTEVMAIALSLGLNAGKNDISTFATPLLLERTIAVNTVYPVV